eukprot:226849_1
MSKKRKKSIFITIVVVTIMVLCGAIGYLSHIDGSDVSIIDMSLTQKSVTGPPLLPGIYEMNKAYNIFLGRQIYEQSGADIIDYTFNGRYTSDTSGETYEIPLEFKSVPNIAPACDIISVVNSVIHSTSTSVLVEQAKTASHGFSATVDLEVGGNRVSGGDNKKGDNINAKTQMEFGLMFGHSSASRSGKLNAKNGYTYSFALDALNTYYRAEIDWNKYDAFIWKATFNDDVKVLKNNPTNKTIMSFLNNWGSHVLSKMQTGSTCRETAFASSTSTRTDVEDFRKEVSSYSFKWGFWDSQGKDSSATQRTGTWNSKVKYQFNDIHCIGEVEVTSNVCSGGTAT